MNRPKMKALLIAGVILATLAGGCQEKPTTEELLMGYQYTLNQLADMAMESLDEAETQTSQGEMTAVQFEARYQEITLIWAQTIEEIDQDKQYRELWPIIFSDSKPPSLVEAPSNPTLQQWASYIAQVEEYIFIHYQLVDTAWGKLGYS